jgi:predicted ATP-binding protein involved in virulence
VNIQRVEVVGLLGREGQITASMQNDLNILTGRNGAGKTSLLKLVWYIISGNILHALREVSFQRVTVTTSQYECTVHKLSGATCKIELIVGSERHFFEDLYDEDNDPIINAEDRANPLLISQGSSVFFPTFRRLEGGFTLTGSSRFSGIERPRSRNDIEEALLTLSRRMSNEPHAFVSSISTVDIVGLLLRQYADLSEIYNRIQQVTSQEIIQRIKAYKSDTQEVRAKSDEGEDIESANSVIDDIRSKVEAMETRRGEIMTPIEGVRTLVEKLFRHTGIKIGTRLSFGDAAKAVSSDALSAGEKQMLSFICYNAFYKDSIIFIDEPELSLHVDWQRHLFPILLAQQSSNQFVIATHSPFIYSKYPDKEVSIDADRGDAQS